MNEFESGGILHDRLIKNAADAFSSGDNTTFEYASTLYDELKEKQSRHLAHEAIIQTEKTRGLYREPAKYTPVIKKSEFAAPIDLERFEDYPNARSSLKLIDQDNHVILLSRSIAKKLYRCKECREDIPIGSEHVVMGIVQASKKYDHHHLHSACIQDRLLPAMKHVEIIHPKNATASARNKKSRKMRYNSKH